MKFLFRAQLDEQRLICSKKNRSGKKKEEKLKTKKKADYHTAKERKKEGNKSLKKKPRPTKLNRKPAGV